MNRQPLISIITVTYNAGAVIEPTLKSVEEQTFRDFEHIIVDGKSSDDTLSIISRYTYPELEAHSKPDNGIYHGMNRGLQYAKGQYLVFLNAGDRFADKDTLAKYAEAALNNDADIIYGDTVIVNGEGEIKGPRHLSSPSILSYKSYLGGMLICHQAFMVRKEIAPLYSREFKLSADYEWCLECISRSRLSGRINLKTVTIHYLEGGMSQKKKLQSLKERFLIMKRRYGLLPTLKAHLSFIPMAIHRRMKQGG